MTKVKKSCKRVRKARKRVTKHGEDADEGSLTKVLQATERLRRVADALELAVIGEAVRWGEERGDDGIYRRVHRDLGEVADFAVEAVGVAVRAGPYEASTLCDLASRAVTDLVELADLVAEGKLRVRALGIVAKETEEASQEAVRAVLDHLLAPLRGRPKSIRVTELEDRELRKAIRRILARAEPELLKEKARRNRRNQLDVGVQPGPVGTSDLTATLPSEMAAAIKAAVDEAARLRQEADPELRVGAARAWGLADLVLRDVSVTAQVQLGIPVITSSASRIGFAPCGGGEGGPFGASSQSSSHLRDREEAQEYRLVTGEGVDQVDVITEEWAGDSVSSQVPSTLGPGGPHCWISGTEIPGVGYVPPDAVAAIMSNLDTKISRALLDARTGTVAETSNPRYVVTKSMREFVATRDETCRMWGCNRRIRRDRAGYGADLDHATPWPKGESTPTNLSGLCRHHHLLKHSPRWTHRLHPDGSTEWVTPAGVPAMTFPAQWVHTDDDQPLETLASQAPQGPGTHHNSPPVQGANELAAAFAEAPPF